ncbi:hypothetical protein H4582DRAFT_124450 [Lactarius indigo]|nr:hypothetical protein H4582DRAFT_124450 [Lactarius indigo]
MRRALLFAAIIPPLVAVSKPSDATLVALLDRQLTSVLLARSGVDPSSISKECQPQCTTIIQTLDDCSSALCECTQANYDALGVCINCLIVLGPPYLGLSPGDSYLDGKVSLFSPGLRIPPLFPGPTVTRCCPTEFRDGCATFGVVLNNVAATATPTGISSTGDPLSLFEPQTPTSGATAAVTASELPFIPVLGSGTNPKNGGPVKLNVLKALGTSTVVAAASVAILGASFF